MRLLLRCWSILTVAAKRLSAQRTLAAASTLGWILAVALTVSVPAYADAVYARMFLRHVARAEENADSIPLLGYLFRYSAASHTPKQWEDIQPVDAYLSHQAAETIGLPLAFLGRYVQTDPFALFPQGQTTFDVRSTPLLWASFGWISDLSSHIVIAEGRYPSETSDATQGQPVEVLVSGALATRLGFQVGEIYTAFFRNERDGFEVATALPVKIVGVWYPADPDEPFWFFDPSTFEERFLVAKGSFGGAIANALDDEVYVAAWYLGMDSHRVEHRSSSALIRGGLEAHQQAAMLLPGIELVNSPVGALQAYRSAKRTLMVLLYAFSLPTVGLMLAFMSLVSYLWVERHRLEVAVLRGRGATSRQVVMIALVQGLLQAGLAFPLGMFVGLRLSQLIGRARGFLDFTLPKLALDSRLTSDSLRLGALAIGLALVTLLLPTRETAEETVVTYRRERARMMRSPWWRRAGLDFLLLLPAGYGLYLLRGQGSLLPVTSVLRGSPMDNPLLFLVPSLGLVGLTLVSLRVVSSFMAFMAWVLSHTKSLTLLVAVRYLARTPRAYAIPLALLILTLSLSIFTATLAQTLNAHLHDQMFYAVGADLQLTDVGKAVSEDVQAYLGSGQTDATAGPRWLFVPVSEYEALPGARRATRVGHYAAVAQTPSGERTATFMGIDRVDFPAVAFWRDDFASESLGALMNRLAISPNGVLVPKSFMQDSLLEVGDRLQARVDMFGQVTVLDLVVVGDFDLFPTWYPQTGPLLVGNLDYLFQQAGGQFPYSIWMTTEEDVDVQLLVDTARQNLGQQILDWKVPSVEILKEQQRPERQGLFGVLSLGFAATGLLTVLGFTLYAVFSFEQRSIEFGVLRAIGLAASSMRAVLTWELALLLGLGAGVGTLLGSAISLVFIPYFQVGTTEVERIPPYVTEIAWREVGRVYWLLGLLFIVALTSLVWALRRMQLFKVIKLGGEA